MPRGTIEISPPAMSGRMFDRCILGSLAIAFGYAVFRFGGYELADWNVTLLVIGLTSAVYWLRMPRSDLAPPIQPWLLWTSLLLPAYVALQLVPLPVFMLNVLSPARAGLLDSLHHITTAPAFAPVSIDPATTVQYLFKFIAYALVFLLIREIAWHSLNQHSWAPAIPLIAVGALEAGLGLLQSAQGEAVASGTYANKNHFAGLLEMVLPICVAYGVAVWNSQSSLKSFPALRALIACLVLAVALLIFAGLVAAASKMGLFSGLCGLFVVGVLALWTMLRGWSRRLALTGLGASLLFIVIFVPSDQLIKGYASLFSDETGEERLPIWADTLQLIGSYPLTGCGLGNYETAFQKFQTTVIDRDVTFAHNDYLEIASELGVVGFVIAGALFVGIFSKALRASLRARDRNAQLLGLGCVGGMTAIAVHSLADFNLYMPANAMLLAWISGIAASLTVPKADAPERSSKGRPVLKTVAVVLSFLLIAYAPVWILFERKFAGDQRIESLFCDFGICDTDAVLAAQVREHGGKISSAPLPELVKALRRSSGSPNRWCDLGEAMMSRGRVEEAQYCFSTGLALGPYVPSVALRAATFYYSIRDPHRALKESSNILEKTEAYDDMIFQSYRAQQLPLDEILHDGLPPGPRAARAYLRYQMGIYNQAAAPTVWNWNIAHGYANDPLAGDYVNFLFHYRQYESAAHAWASYLGARRNGYLDTDWLFNGDFETEPLEIPLDWHMENLGEDVEVARDVSVAHTGLHSLRIEFGGNVNVNYSHTSQTAFVTPGRYRFEAFIRTQEISTDQGIGFHIFGAEQPRRVDIETERLVGTHDWKKIEAVVDVPSGTKLLVIQIVREPSWKFDSLIKGTAWIDSVRLVKLG
jgi:putative inorganic carbon (hco3(-)) transporter